MQFDLDGGGEIEIDELRKLGTARRTLGQKSSPWTAEKNAAYLKKMDKDGNGSVDEEEFVRWFKDALPFDPASFDEVIQQFLEVAKGQQESARSSSNAPKTSGQKAEKSATASPPVTPTSEPDCAPEGDKSVFKAAFQLIDPEDTGRVNMSQFEKHLQDPALLKAFITSLQTAREEMSESIDLELDEIDQEREVISLLVLCCVIIYGRFTSSVVSEIPSQ